MKTFSSDLLASYDKNVTTITNCIKIQRLDNEIYRFTTLDKDLVIDGETYISSYAFDPSSYVSALGLQIENMDIQGAMNVLNIYDLDLFKNLFYGAYVWVFSVDYKNLGAGKNKILYGSVGEIEVTDKTFKMELRGMSKRYENLYAAYYGKLCRARLGDDKCKVDLAPYTLYGTVNSIASGVTVLTNFLSLEFKTTGSLEVRIKDISCYDRVGNIITPIAIYQTGTDDFKCSDNIVRDLYNLIDNNEDTYVCLNTTSNTTTTLIIEFSSAVNIDKIVVKDQYSYNNNKISEVHIKKSINGYTWYTVLDVIASTYRNGDIVTIPLGAILTPDGTNKYRFISNDVVNAGKEDNYYQYGNIKWLSGANNGLQCEIIQNDTGGNVELALPMPYDIQGGDTFSMTPGCNHLLITKDDTIVSRVINPSYTTTATEQTTTKNTSWGDRNKKESKTPFFQKLPLPERTTASGDCKVKFNNVVNFRGEPYLPNEDVLLSGYIAIKEAHRTDEEGEPIILEPV